MLVTGRLLESPSSLCANGRSDVLLKKGMIVRNKNILITGLPGTGKTTLLRNVAEELKPLHPAGFFSLEIRETNIRKGFEMVSLGGEKGLLAHVNLTSPYQVGR